MRRKARPAPLRRLWIICCVALCVLLRADDLTSDPPTDLEASGGYFADEGFWTHNARNKVLFGEFSLDEWNNMYASPLSHWPQYAVFRLLGVGLVQARLVPVLMSAASCALAAAMPGEAGVVAALLFAVDPLMVHFGRIALLETPVIALLLLAWALLAGSLGPWKLALAGCAAGMAVATKPSAWFFLPAAAIAVVTAPPPGGRVRAMRWFCLGGAAAAAFWLLMVGRGMGLFLQYGRYYASQQAPWWGNLWENIKAPMLFSRFRYSLPAALWGALVAAGTAASAFRCRLPRPVTLAVLWAVFGALSLTTLTYDPLRYYMPLLPALLILAAWGITEAWHGRLRLGGPVAAVALSLPFVGPLAADRLRELMPSACYWPLWRHAVVFTLVATGVAVGWRAMATVLTCPRWRRIVALAALLASITNAAWRHSRWLSTRGHAVHATSLMLGERIAPTVFTGQWAPELCLENRHRAVPVWPGFVNDRGDPFATFGITHGVIWARHWERFLGWFPERFARAAILDTLWIKDSPVILCRFPEADRSPFEPPSPAPEP